MAKQRRQGGARRGKTKGSGPAGGGAGATAAALAALAAVLAGGTYLYRHTGDLSRDSARLASDGSRPASPAGLPSTQSPFHPATPTPESSLPPGTSTAKPLPAAGVPPLPPFGTSEEVFENGARLYAANCAGCHGRPGKNGRGPSAAQFWDRSHTAGTHAVAQSAGVLYQATARGNLVAGMPSYGQRLTDTQLWDLALLMKSAHDDLPDPVVRLLRGGQ